MSQDKVHEQKMRKTVDAMLAEFAAIRAGRANPAILNRVRVDYYGTPTPINQMAAISVSEARVLVIQPWDISTLKNIERAIQMANLGLNPTNDGKVLRIVFPPLTEERRKELVKMVRKQAEESRIAVRSIRRDAIEEYKKMLKQSQMTEDDLKDAEKDIQALTEKFCKEIDGLAEKKEQEIMSV